MGGEYIYIYIYIYMCVCVCVCVCIIFVHVCTDILLEIYLSVRKSVYSHIYVRS